MTQLSLVGVSKIFGNSTVVDNVSVTVEPGKVHVLLGENGAGKSTVIKMMSGIYQPDKGISRPMAKRCAFPMWKLRASLVLR